MISRQAPYIFCLGLALFATQTLAAQQVPSVTIGKAISMHGVLNWPEMQKEGAEPRYVWPPFTTSRHALRPDDLQRLKQAGFDTIRLTVGLGLFLSANEERAEQLDALLLKRAQTVVQEGLNVIVDFHPITQDPRYPPLAFTRGAGTPQVEAFRQVLIRTARTLSTLPADKVVLELLNEPATKDWSAAENALWQETQKSYYKSVRAVAPNLTLMVTGCCTPSGLELTTLDPSGFPDRNLFYTFHFYAPHAFTHQGVKNAKEPLAALNFFQNVPYPLTVDELAAAQSAARQKFEAAAQGQSLPTRLAARHALEATNKRLAEYADPAAIEETFKKTADWAKKNGIPPQQVFVGELGVMRPNVAPAARQVWLRATVAAAEKNGFPWAYWSFEQPEYMGLLDNPTTRKLDPETLTALGLTPPKN